jgi:eukaryotic-like serine/threonine-protein kinase
MSSVVKFGVYELDNDAMELRKHGMRIRLQEQPFLVLASLVERPGEIVTRDELRERIWAKDTFVDFDQSLNKAVNRLREALNDNAGQPRYVETVPRRGYRFVAPVTGGNPAEEHPPAVSPVTLDEPRKHERTGNQTLWLWGIALIAGAGVLVVLGVTAGVWLRKPQTAAQHPLVRITREGLAYESRLSRDGKLLAYSSSTGGGKQHIWVRQMAGGEAIPVTNGASHDGAPDFSPDGTQIAFTRDGVGIFIVATFGGYARLLVKGGMDPKFSPDGNDVVFLRLVDDRNPGVFVIPSWGGQPRRICPNWYGESALWSPNGKSILFLGFKTTYSSSGKWLLAPAGGGEPKEFHLPGDTYQDARFPDVETWTRVQDGRQWIVFTSGTADTRNVFRVAVSPSGKVAAKAEQLTSGTGFDGSVDLSTDGKLVFTSFTGVGQIWSIPVDANRAQTRGEPIQITHSEGVDNRSPSISRDGRWLAYAVMNSGDASIQLRDLSTGMERQLNERKGDRGMISISPDGSAVAYLSFLNAQEATYLIPAAGGTPVKLCEDCFAKGFSADGSVLLTQQGWNEKRSRIVAVRTRGAEASNFLANSEYHLYGGFFSWDDRWVAFKMVLEEPLAKLMIAPVRNGVPGDQSQWISITDGKNADSKSQFSPDGNTLYFNSLRDGHLCIWAQRLDRTTKHPTGEPFAIQHFHNAQSWTSTSYMQRFTELSVARDKIVTNLRERHGDIWMMKVD